MASAGALYTPEVLGLATGLAAFPLDDSLPLRGRARSPACGSALELGLELDAGERIARLGIKAHSCAIGQASAAIFAGHAVGRSRQELAATLAALEGWLAGGPRPDWPGITAIAAARDFPGRHGAMLLPWKAALDALCTAATGR